MYAPWRWYHFTSARKRMSTAIGAPGITWPGPGGGAGGVRLHCKGASEIVVKLCTKVMNIDGSVAPITPADLQAAEQAIEAGSGCIENMRFTEVESTPPPPPRVCMSSRSGGKSCYPKSQTLNPKP